MEIFNIHLFEFLLIAGLALVVFGPERLPEVGRFAGKQVARFLAWQQQSPELKMINDVRSEFEQEIASLRDELVRTRRQLDLSQDGTLNSIREDLRPMLNLRDELKSPLSATAPATPAPASAARPKTWDPPADGDAPVERLDPELEAELERLEARTAELERLETDTAEAAAAGQPADPAPPDDLWSTELPAAPAPPASGDAAAQPAPRPAPDGTVQAAARPNRLAATEPTTVFDRPDRPEARPPAGLNGQGPAHHAAPASAEELRLIMQQLERVSADLQALIGGLQAQGVLGADWEPEAAIAEQESMSR